MKKTIRVFAGIGAVVLIVILLFVTMSFAGNPISKVLATRTADKYVREKYSDLELDREKTYYNFKDGNYGVKYIKRRSKDIHFDIKTDYLGRLKYDGYKEDVLSKWNTRLRLEDDYGAYVEQIVKNGLDYDFDMIIPSTFTDSEKEQNISNLEIDMMFDINNIPFEQGLTLYIYENDKSWERLSKVVIEVDKLIEKNNIDVSKYTIVLEGEEGNGESLGIYDFPRKDLNSEELPKVLEEFFTKSEYNDKEKDK